MFKKHWVLGVLGFWGFWGVLAVIQVQEVDRKVQEVKVCIFPPPPHFLILFHAVSPPLPSSYAQTLILVNLIVGNFKRLFGRLDLLYLPIYLLDLENSQKPGNYRKH